MIDYNFKHCILKCLQICIYISAAAPVRDLTKRSWHPSAYELPSTYYEVIIELFPQYRRKC